jgi:hypothetical protein
MAESPSIKTISNFKSVLKGGGARPNLFEVTIPEFPSYVTKDGEMLKDLTFMCKGANLPASNVASIDVPFRGRTLKVAGDRTFDPWTITVINDEDFRIRHAFETWMNGISKLSNNTGASNPNAYMKDAYVYQLGRGTSGQIETTTAVPDAGPGRVTQTKANVLRSYRFYDIFPTSVSEIALSYDTGDTVEEFTVELQVQYFEIDGGPGALN